MDLLVQAVDDETFDESFSFAGWILAKTKYSELRAAGMQATVLYRPTGETSWHTHRHSQLALDTVREKHIERTGKPLPRGARVGQSGAKG